MITSESIMPGVIQQSSSHFPDNDDNNERVSFSSLSSREEEKERAVDVSKLDFESKDKARFF